MVNRKAGCERCQALLAGNGRRCRKLAQCRARSAKYDVALCNVHEEYVYKHGIDSLRYDVKPQFQPVPSRLPPFPPLHTKPTQQGVDESDALRQLAATQASQQRQITELLQRLDRKPEMVQQPSGAVLNQRLQDLADAQRAQRDAIKDLVDALRKSVTTVPAVSTATVSATAPPVAIAAISRALKRISEQQKQHSDQLQSVSSRIDVLQREQRQQRTPRVAEQEKKQAEPPAPSTIKPPAAAAPQADKKRLPLPRQLDAVVNKLEQSARLAHGEIGTLRSLGATFCRRLKREQIEKELQPLTALLDRIDELIASVRDDIVQANADASNANNVDAAYFLRPLLDKRSKEQRALQRDLEQQTENVRKRLEKRCRQKRFTLAPALRFAQDVLAGKVRCNKSAVPVALRNWFASGATDQDDLVGYNWIDRHLLCNLSDAELAAADNNEDENEDGEVQMLSAFARGQALNDDFKVYDTKGNVVAIGRQTDNEDDERRGGMAGDIGAGVSGGENAADAGKIDALLRQYLRLLDTLNLLIDLYAVAGRDTRGLGAERQALRQSVANLALKAGRERALQLMSAERYDLLMLQASLMGAYAPYLETEEGIAELASLAAFAASERARADGVSDSLRRQVARQTYAQTLRALTIVGGAGALTQALWLLFAGAPRTAAPIVPSMPRAAPPVNRASPAFAAPALPLPSAAVSETPSDAALPFVFREQTLANNRARAQHAVQQLVDQTARDSVAVESLTPIDSARIKIAALFNETRSYGARQFPLTRNQWRREQLGNALELLSPSSRHIERLYERVQLGRVQVRPRLQLRLQQQAQTRAERLRGAAALELRGEQQQAQREPLGLLGEREREREASIPLFLPSGGLYEGVGASGPVSYLPGTAAGAAITAPSALGQLASNANLLSAVAQALGPAAPVVVDFDPAVQQLMQQRGYNVSDADELLAANADMFADRATLLRNFNRGLGALQTYRAQRFGPSAQARRRDPQSAEALASASDAALRAVEEQPENFFDDLRAPLLGDAAESVAQSASLTAIEETPLHFLQQTAGIVGASGLRGTDVQRMSERIDSIAGGFTNNTALDLHLERLFERYRASGASALEIGVDAGMLAAAADERGSALREFRLSGGKMTAERRQQAESAVNAAALLAEREFGGGAQVQEAASVALKARELRDLFARDAQTLHGFVSGLVETAFEKSMVELQRANDALYVLAKVVRNVGDVTIDQASLIAESVGDALAAIGDRALEKLQSREEIDRLMFKTLSQNLGDALTEERIRYIVDATLDGLSETGRVSTEAGERIGIALKRVSKDIAATAADVSARLSDVLSEQGRAWSQYGEEQSRAALRVLGRAGKSLIEKAKRNFDALQRDAPEVWRNEVQPRLKRAGRAYTEQINYLARNYMPPADASEAARVQAALDMHERGMQAFRELQQIERTLLEDVRDRLASRKRATFEEQRRALLATARMRGQQRAELERRMSVARQAELARLANATIVAPPNTPVALPGSAIVPEPTANQRDVRERVLFDSGTQSIHYAEWQQELQQERLGRMQAISGRAQDLVDKNKKVERDTNAVESVDEISKSASQSVDQKDFEVWDASQSAQQQKFISIMECLNSVDAGAFAGWVGKLRLIGAGIKKYSLEDIDACAQTVRADPRIVTAFKNLHGESERDSLAGFAKSTISRSVASGTVAQPSESIPKATSQAEQQGEVPQYVFETVRSS